MLLKTCGEIVFYFNIFPSFTFYSEPFLTESLSNFSTASQIAQTSNKQAYWPTSGRKPKFQTSSHTNLEHVLLHVLYVRVRLLLQGGAFYRCPRVINGGLGLRCDFTGAGIKDVPNRCSLHTLTESEGFGRPSLNWLDLANQARTYPGRPN